MIDNLSLNGSFMDNYNPYGEKQLVSGGRVNFGAFENKVLEMGQQFPKLNTAINQIWNELSEMVTNLSDVKEIGRLSVLDGKNIVQRTNEMKGMTS